MARSSEKKKHKWHIPADAPGLHQIVKRMSKLSDREAAIVGFSLVEATLEAVVRAHMVQDADSRMHQPGGILSSAYANAQIGHAFGFIPSDLKAEIDRLANVRNKFAHSVGEVEFGTVTEAFDIPSLCSELRIVETYGDILHTVGTSCGAWEATLDPREGIYVENSDGGIVTIMRSGTMLVVTFSNAEISDSPRERYLASIRFSWAILQTIFWGRSFPVTPLSSHGRSLPCYPPRKRTT